MKSILIQTIERNPDVLWDVLDCGRFDGTQGNSSGPSQDPSPPAPSSPSWCTCSNCREMPQEDEKVCCGKLPDYCLSNIPVSIVFISFCSIQNPVTCFDIFWSSSMRCHQIGARLDAPQNVLSDRLIHTL